MSLKGNCPGGIRANNFSSKKGYKTYTQYKSILNLVNLIQIWMVTTLLWLIQNQTYFFAQCSETYAKTFFRFLLHFSLNKILILSFDDKLSFAPILLATRSKSVSEDSKKIGKYPYNFFFWKPFCKLVFGYPWLALRNLVRKNLSSSRSCKLKFC